MFHYFGMSRKIKEKRRLRYGKIIIRILPKIWHISGCYFFYKLLPEIIKARLPRIAKLARSKTKFKFTSFTV